MYRNYTGWKRPPPPVSEGKASQAERRTTVCAMGIKGPDVLQTGHMQSNGETSEMRQSMNASGKHKTVGGLGRVIS